MDDYKVTSYDFILSEEVLTPLRAFYWANKDSLKSMHEYLSSQQNTYLKVRE